MTTEYIMTFKSPQLYNDEDYRRIRHGVRPVVIYEYNPNPMTNMSLSIQLDKCSEFLAKNGWQEDLDIQQALTRTFILNNIVLDLSVELNEIVFTGSDGDFLCTPLNIFALIGGLHYSRLLPGDYIY